VETETSERELELFATRELLKKRKIWLADITENAASRIIGSIAVLNAQSTDPITLLIRSNGGQVIPGFDIYDAIRLSVANVIGVVIGGAHSTASLVLQACSQRRMAHHATILIHNIRKSDVEIKMLDPDSDHPYGRLDADSIIARCSPLVRSKQNIVKIYSDRTGKTPAEIIKAMNEERVFTAEGALEFGLVDEVI
jgi:ATP-dependent Clp protease protease subunit